MKKFLKGKKGLTLVELLAVIVILGVVAAIAVPAIGKTITNSKINADKATYQMIVDAATRQSLDDQAAGGDGEVTNESVSNLTGYLASIPGKFQSHDTKTFTNYSVDVTDGVISVTVTDGTGNIDPVADFKTN